MKTDRSFRRLAAPLLSLAILGLSQDCARPPETGATVVSGGALRALPKESVGLLVVQVDSLRRLQAVSRWMEEMAQAAEEGTFRQVKDRFGMELLEKVDRMGLAIVPRPDGALGWALVVEGRFDEARLRQALGGQDILTLVEAEGKPDLSATALAGGGLALGPRAILERVRANAARPGGGMDAGARLLEPLRKVQPASQIWGAIDCRTVATLARDAARTQGLPDPTQSAGIAAVDSLLSIAFQGKVAASVEFSLVGQASGEAKAKELADAARGLVALARMGTTQDRGREWLEFLDAIAIDQKGTEITLRGLVPEKMMAGLASTARAAAHDAAGGPASAPPSSAGSPPPPASPPAFSSTPASPSAAPPGAPPAAEAPAPSVPAAPRSTPKRPAPGTG